MPVILTTLTILSIFQRLLSSAFLPKTSNVVVIRRHLPINAQNDNNNDNSGGYKFGDLSRNLAKKLTKSAENVTGKEYKFGDLSRHLDKKSKEKVSAVIGKKYEFGDLSKWADANVKKQVCEMTGKTDYTPGDLSKEILKRASSGEYKLEDIAMLFKILLSIGASISPLAGALPAKVLIELLNYSIAAQVGDKAVGALSSELDRRMKEAVTGNPEYQLGDFTKGQLMKFINKDEYSFGDITKTITEKMKDSKDASLFVNSKSKGDVVIEVTDENVLVELEQWDKALKIVEDQDEPKGDKKV